MRPGEEGRGLSPSPRSRAPPPPCGRSSRRAAARRRERGAAAPARWPAARPPRRPWPGCAGLRAGAAEASAGAGTAGSSRPSPRGAALRPGAAQASGCGPGPAAFPPLPTALGGSRAAVGKASGVLVLVGSSAPEVFWGASVRWVRFGRFWMCHQVRGPPPGARRRPLRTYRLRGPVPPWPPRS